MSAVWMRVRAERRARWRAWLALAVVGGIIGGAAIASAAGARRTMGAYPRFVDRYGLWDATVSTGGHPETDEMFERIASLPIVEDVARGGLLIGSIRAPTGEELAFPDVFLTAIAEQGPLFDASLKLLDGAIPDPAAADQVMLNYLIAERLDVDVGDRLRVTVRSFPFPGAPSLPEAGSTVRVAAVYAAVGQFESLRESGFPTTVTFTPAFLHANRRYHNPGEDTLAVRLRGRGTAVPEFKRTLEGFNPPLDQIGSSADFTPAVQDLNRVPAMTLWVLSGLLGLAAILIVGQALSREAAALADEGDALRALGMVPLQRATVDIARGLGVATGCALVAIGVASLLSTLMPIGLAHIAEPHPGFSFDAMAFLVGAAGLVGGIVFAALPAASRSARGRRVTDARPSIVAAGLARRSAPIPAVTGVGLALRAGQGRAAVPVRTTILGATIAVVLVAAALVFTGSMDRLRADPRLSGFTWDAEVEAFEGPDSVLAELRAMPEVERAWAGSFFAVACVAGQDLAAVSFDGGDIALVTGTRPQTPDEVALDGRTMRILGVAPGDTIPVRPADQNEGCTGAPASRPEGLFEVVGRFVPARHPFIGANAGQAIAFSPEGARSVGVDHDGAYVRFVPGVTLNEGVRALRAHFGDRVFAVVSRAQNTSARNVGRIAQLPIVLAVVLAALALATLAHTLLLTIRQRRRELAVLKTLGLVGRQVRATVAWQATTLVALALVFGVPLGIASGRWGWRFFAEGVEVVPVSVVPVILVPVIVGAGLLVANLIAALPARAAARTKPALVLRSE